MTYQQRHRLRQMMANFAKNRPLLIPKHKPEPRRDEPVKYFEDKH